MEKMDVAMIFIGQVNGPLKCSGLQIRRYDLDMLMDLLGDGFELQGHEFEDHETPDGAKQQFLCTSWTRKK